MAPFTLLLPYVGLAVDRLLSVIIGLILASAFSAILVFAQELMPGKVGAVSGLFFGFAFGMGGIGAAVLGAWPTGTASSSCIGCAPSCRLLGIVAAFLPDIERRACGALRDARSHLADHAVRTAHRVVNVLLDQIGLPVPAMPTLVLAGAIAADGSFASASLFAASVLACIVPDCVWFLVGQRYGIRVLKTLCRISLEPDSCVNQTQIALRALGDQLSGDRQVRARARHHRAAAGGRHAHRLAAIHLL